MIMQFPTPTGNPVFYRTYLRRNSGKLETPEEAIARSLQGSDAELLTEEEKDLCLEYGLNLYSLPSGRRLWYGGTESSENLANIAGLYNCNSLDPRVLGLDVFRLCFDNLMLGCGVGVVVESDAIASLPLITNQLNVKISVPLKKSGWIKENSLEDTFFLEEPNRATIVVGDSRKGWIDAYMFLLNMATAKTVTDKPIEVAIDLSNIRPAGTPIKGFGGKANPDLLPQLFIKIAEILNGAYSRKLNAIEVCLLLDEPASVVVSGNVRRSAGIRQGSNFDSVFGQAKSGLWQKKNGDGVWRIDPKRDALRMANHTRVFHRIPTEAECIESIQQQYYSGEGAIQYAPEAIARSNVDLLGTEELKQAFIKIYTSLGSSAAKKWLKSAYPKIAEREVDHRIQRYGLNPCGEILGHNFFCNLAEVHLNQLAEEADDVIEQAFRVASINAARQLIHKFDHSELQYSREIDPIVGVSFTGLFDFFVIKFGEEYLWWWKLNRPSIFMSSDKTTKHNLAEFFRDQERSWLSKFRLWTQKYVWEFCDRHGLKRPNRYTTVQPSGTKSLLTGASPGWHPPKATRFIRRITFRKNDPVALACIDCGYNVIPSQSDKDENGQLLDDPFSPICTEWLVEIPVAVAWADMADKIDFDPSQISALAQFDFAMQVQRHYTGHNTSATIELRENEIVALGKRIHQAIANNEGYVSFALLSRFDDLETFPRLPFEPISKEKYQELTDKALPNSVDFGKQVNTYLSDDFQLEGPAPCDSDKCLIS